MAIDYTSTPTGMPEETTQKAENARRALMQRLEQARTVMTERSRDAARYANQQVHTNPWASVGVAFAAGVVFGALVALAAADNVRSRRGFVERFR